MFIRVCVCCVMSYVKFGNGLSVFAGPVSATISARYISGLSHRSARRLSASSRCCRWLSTKQCAWKLPARAWNELSTQHNCCQLSARLRTRKVSADPASWFSTVSASRVSSTDSAGRLSTISTRWVSSANPAGRISSPSTTWICGIISSSRWCVRHSLATVLSTLTSLSVVLDASVHIANRLCAETTPTFERSILFVCHLCTVHCTYLMKFFSLAQLIGNVRSGI